MQNTDYHRPRVVYLIDADAMIGEHHRRNLRLENAIQKLLLLGMPKPCLVTPAIYMDYHGHELHQNGTWKELLPIISTESAPFSAPTILVTTRPHVFAQLPEFRAQEKLWGNVRPDAFLVATEIVALEIAATAHFSAVRDSHSRPDQFTVQDYFTNLVASGQPVGMSKDWYQLGMANVHLTAALLHTRQPPVKFSIYDDKVPVADLSKTGVGTFDPKHYIPQDPESTSMPRTAYCAAPFRELANQRVA